jgi:hypothetical protein
MEGLARLFVGIGFLWVALILVWGLAAGIDQPYLWYRWAADSTGWPWLRIVYLALAVFVVPMGMLVFLKDIFGDPVASWVKWAAPGAFLAIYAFFLLVALPDTGGPLFGTIESIVAPMASQAPIIPGKLGSSWNWLLRFAMAFLILAGGPAVIGAIVGVMTGSSAKTKARRR